jgi:hypothetical protein
MGMVRGVPLVIALAKMAHQVNEVAMLYCDLTFEFVLFGFFCVSTTLYMFVLWILATAPSSDKILCTPFFRIIISTGTLDIIAACSNYFLTKFRL